jgi:hypothetical protein
MTVTPDMRRKFDELKDRKRDAKDRVTRAEENKRKFSERVTAAGGKIDTQSRDFKLAHEATDELVSARAVLETLKEEESFYLQRMVGASTLNSQNTFMSDPDKMTELARLAESQGRIGSMPLGLGVTRDQVIERLGRSADSGATPGTLEYQGSGRVAPWGGLVAPLLRPLRLLDVVPATPMEQRVFPYTQVLPAFGTAQEVSELAIKPEAGLELIDMEARAVTIAHWTKTAKQTLADMTQLQATIENLLTWGVSDRVEKQIVNGTGVGENLLGILNTTGIGVVDYDASKLAADQVLSGITTVLLSSAQPNAIVCNPLDWEAMLVLKAALTGAYLSGGAFSATTQALWQTPLIPSIAIQQGQALVGDFQRGCSLLVREGVSVTVSDADSDDFTRNRCTLLGEGRYAFAIWQPACFALVNLAA